MNIIPVIIYTLSFLSINGNTINMNDYKGKKILLVNIATDSKYVQQLASLEQLYEKYQDSLVVIAFPSNSFGAESRSDKAIKTFCEDNYHANFILAAKTEVVGENANDIYKWLSSADQNGVVDNKMVADFEKILIDKDGMIAGVFAPTVDPMSDEIQDVIK